VEGTAINVTENLALLPAQEGRISVEQVNHKVNARYYWSNDKPEKPSYAHWQYDGFTQKISRSIPVEAGKACTLTFVLFDRRDGIYDSGVFVNVSSTAGND